MKKIGYLVLSGLALVACDQSKEMTTDKSGLKYTIHQAGTEEIPSGNTMLVHFVAKDANDSIWMDSRPDELPRPARKVDSIWYLNQGGIEEVLFHMKKGDSVSCQIPVEKIYGNRPLPQGVEQGSLLTVGLKVEDAMDQEAFGEYRKEMMDKQLEIVAKKAEEQLALDIEEIDTYLAENSINAQKTESGLRYVITQEGKGDNVQSGQTIKANYSGRVLNGAFFDSSDEEIAKENGLYQEGRPYGSLETAIGVGAVIRGWDEGFQLMNTGTKATLYIPSGLGYGPRANGAKIPANSILVFDVELLEIIE